MSTDVTAPVVTDAGERTLHYSPFRSGFSVKAHLNQGGHEDVMAGQERPKWGLTGAAAGIGLIIVVAAAIAVPVLRVFLLISIPLGAAVAAILYLWHTKRPIKEPKDESIKLNLK